MVLTEKKKKKKKIPADWTQIATREFNMGGLARLERLTEPIDGLVNLARAYAL